MVLRECFSCLHESMSKKRAELFFIFVLLTCTFLCSKAAAAGVNPVRWHHLDTSRWPRGIWNSADGKDIAPEALDRLDFFINQLALHGIFVNLTPHVGRVHSTHIGF